MNSRPWENKSDSDDLFRALAYAEMVLNASSFEDVKATYVWNTHGPWSGPEENLPYNILDLDNNLEPRGDIIKIINENLFGYFVEVPRVSGFVRTYACVDDLNNNLNVFLINKNDTSETISLKTLDFEIQSNYTIKTYSGNGSDDKSPRCSEITYNEINDENLKVELGPLSFTIIQMKLK